MGNRNYKVYAHINKENGCGYKTQSLFFDAII